MMYDMNVTHAVGIDEIAYAVLENFNNDPTKATKSELFAEIANNFLTGRGLNDGSWDDMSDDDIEEAYRIARTLFPELNVLETKK
jgi:hypothetical protein